MKGEVNQWPVRWLFSIIISVCVHVSIHLGKIQLKMQVANISAAAQPCRAGGSPQCWEQCPGSRRRRDRGTNAPSEAKLLLWLGCRPGSWLLVGWGQFRGVVLCRGPQSTRGCWPGSRGSQEPCGKRLLLQQRLPTCFGPSPLCWGRPSEFLLPSFSTPLQAWLSIQTNSASKNAQIMSGTLEKHVGNCLTLSPWWT